MNTKKFTKWMKEHEEELRHHVSLLYWDREGWRLGIDAGDLFHDVFIRLERHDHPIESKGKLFALVAKSAANRLLDLSRKHSFRSAFYVKPLTGEPMSPSAAPLETVPSNEPSPSALAALRDQVAVMRKIAAADPTLRVLLKTLEEFTEQGESVSTARLSRHLDLPRRKVEKSMEKLRAAAIAAM
jgi:DNA-directed RNA polymerase specialized sigma24 family protein